MSERRHFRAADQKDPSRQVPLGALRLCLGLRVLLLLEVSPSFAALQTLLDEFVTEEDLRTEACLETALLVGSGVGLPHDELHALLLARGAVDSPELRERLIPPTVADGSDDD